LLWANLAADGGLRYDAREQGVYKQVDGLDPAAGGRHLILILRIIGWIAAVLTLGGLAYVAAAAIAVLRLTYRFPPVQTDFPAILVLKPLCGAEPGLEAALESVMVQDYPGPVRIVFGVHDRADPAIPIAEKLIAAHLDAWAQLVVDPALHGANRKISNLINMRRMAAATSGDEIVVLADSDVVVPPDYLRRLASELAPPGVGAVTCIYVGRPVAGFWSELSANAIDHHFMPNVALGMALGMAHPCFGPTIALRAETLDAIGGFETVADHLADDYRIGELVRGLGLETHVTSWTVEHLCTERTLSELFDHELRWARTIRLIDPAGFVGSGIVHALPFALIAWACLGFGLWPSLLLIVTLAARIGLAMIVNGAANRKNDGLSLVPARDLLSFAVFLAALGSTSVSWRGRRFRIGREGDMRPAEGF
jgi:ceramide glucosyltransferase